VHPAEDSNDKYSAGNVPKMINDLLYEKTIIAVFPLYNSEVDLKFFTPPSVIF